MDAIKEPTMPTIEEITKAASLIWVNRMVDDLLRPNLIVEAWERSQPPITRWQKFSAPWKWRTRRVRDAWGVLTGRLEANSE